MSTACTVPVPGPAAACPACEANDRESCGEKNGSLIYICRSCGTLYAECSPIEYDGYYDESNLTVPEFVLGQLDNVFAGLKSYRRVNRLLDIGCGAGSLLEAARRAGWEAEGLEISEPAVAKVRSLGFKVFCGEISEANYSAESFDIVTASELIEHVTDPVAMLKEVARILRPGGLLWATTPNARGLSARMLGVDWSVVCPPEHRQLFSPEGIRHLVERGGFSRVRISSRGCNPFGIWHGLRRKRTDPANFNGSNSSGKNECQEVPVTEPFDNTASSYHLNEFMLRNPLTRAIKATTNAALGLTGLGDSIRFQAEK